MKHHRSSPPAVSRVAVEFPDRVPMSADAARQIVDIVQRKAGIRIDARNGPFLSFRLDRRIRELGLVDYDTYLTQLRGAAGANEIQYLVESLATHTTSFFREEAHYQWLAEKGVEMIKNYGAGHAHTLTVWSAACSSGEELWSAGMLLDEESRKYSGGIRWTLVGSDVSEAILRKAKLAVYGASDLSGLSKSRRSAYLLRSRAGAAISPSQRIYRISPDLRNRATFLRANLLENLDGTIPLVDIVFLRNVLIYFSAEDRLRVVQNVMRRMRPGALLLLGHSDNLQVLPPNLVACGTAIFRKE